MTSTGISLRLLQDLNLYKKFDIPMIIKISVIEDLLTVFAFTIISSPALRSATPLHSLAISIGESIAMFIVAYIVFSIIFNKFMFRMNLKEEDLLMLALGILLLMVSLSAILGVSTAFGAYVSGSIISTWKDRWKSLDHDLKNFSYLFISFFFLTVGLSVDLSNLSWLLLLVVFPAVLISKFLGVFTGSYALLRSSRPAFFNAISMLSRGELSLIIVSAAVTSSLLPARYLGLTAFIVFFTVVFSFFVLNKSAEIYTYFRIRFPRIRGIS